MAPGISVETDTSLALTAHLFHDIGINQVSNGHFTENTTGWTASGTTTLSVVNGRLRVAQTSGASAARGHQTITTVVGRTYKLTGTAWDGVSEGAIYVGTSAGNNSLGSILGTSGGQTSTIEFVATGATTYITCINTQTYAPGTGQYSEYDNISCVQVVGETDTSLNLTPVVSIPLGLSTEIDTAFALSQTFLLPVGLSIETDTPFNLGLSTGLIPSTEVNTSFNLGLTHGLGLSSETDIALALGGLIPIGLCTETDTAIALGLLLPLGLCWEHDFALRLNPTSTARPMSKEFTIGRRIPANRTKPRIQKIDVNQNHTG